MEQLQRLEEIDRMSEGELDALPFGAIRLDKDGKIPSIQAVLAGRVDPDTQIGPGEK